MVFKITDKEVLAVITALALVGSVVYAASLFRPKYIEPLTAIGLLDKDCTMGNYPSIMVNGENASLCLLLVNYNSTPALLRVDYKIAPPTELPSNTTPSPLRPLRVFYYALPPGANETHRITVPVEVNSSLTGKRVALVFELWRYDPRAHEWRYTGEWVHLYVRVLPRP